MSKIERAKAAGWRIECLGDQQGGLWNWLLTDVNEGCIQTQEPLASEVEAWEYFFGHVKGLQYDVGMWQPAAAPAQSTAGEVLEASDPGDSVDRKLFNFVVKQRDDLQTELFDAQADANLFLQSLGNRDLDVVRLESEIADLRTQLAQAQAARDAYGKAIDVLLEGMDFDPEDETVTAMSAGCNGILWANNTHGDYDLLEKIANERAKALQASTPAGGEAG